MIVLISVALCTYNGEKYIAEQLSSILNQTLPPDEIVVCDDCSSDNTINIVEQMLCNWCGKSIIVKNEYNLGFRKNFEKALLKCTGDFIFLSDQDDVWDLNKINIIMNIFKENPKSVMVFHDAAVVDEKLELLGKSLWNILKFNYKLFLDKNYDALKYYNIVQGSACAIKRNILNYAIPFPKEAYHDEWLALVALEFGDIIPCSDQLLLYRQSDINAVGVRKESYIDKLKKVLVGTRKWTKFYLNNIERREKLFTELNKRALIHNKNKIFIDYNYFLTYRKMMLSEKKFFMLLKLKYYVKEHQNFKHAFCEWMKDFWFLLYNFFR